MIWGKYKTVAQVSLLYLLLAWIFFYPVLQGKVLFFLDNMLHIPPMYEFWRDEVLKARIPLWNPYIFAGMPFFADPAHPIANPFNLMFLLIKNAYYATSVQIPLLIWLTSLGTYLLSKQLKLTTKTSIIVGLFYGFSGSIIDSVNDLNSLIGIAFFPWVALAFHKDVIQARRFFSPLLAFLIGLQILSGHTQYVYYELLLMGFGLAFYFGRSTIKDKKVINTVFRQGCAFAITIILALGIGALQLIPSLEMVQQAERHRSFTQQSVKGVSFAMLPRLLSPQLYGTLVEGTSWGPGSQLESGLAGIFGFVNLSALFLAGYTVVAGRKKPLIITLAIISVITFIISFGNNTPLFSVLSNVVPGFQSFRSPVRILVVYSLSMSLLAGLSLEGVLTRKIFCTKPFQLITALLLIALGLSSFLYFFHPTILTPVFLGFYESIKGIPFEFSTAYNLEKVNIISRMLLRSIALFLFGLLPVLALFSIRIKKAPVLFAIFAALVFVESFLSVRGSLLFVHPSVLQPDQVIVDTLKTNLGTDRFISTSETQPYTGIWVYFNHFISRPPFSQEQITTEELENWHHLRSEVSMLPANIHQLQSVKSSAGYAAIIPRSYQDYVNSSNVNSLDYRSYDNPALDAFATRYILTGVPSDSLSDDTSGKFSLFFERGNYRIYKNLHSRPRVELATAEGLKPVTFTLDEDNSQKLLLTTETDQDGLLVLRDFYYPGWQASVDGTPTEIRHYDSLFRAVPVTAGKHEVVFEFKPKTFTYGAIISGLSLVVLIGILINDKISRRLWQKR